MRDLLTRYAKLAMGRPFTPGLLSILVTSVCDMRCTHCFFTAELDDVPRKTLQMTTGEIERISETLGGNLGVLILAGGEPFTRKDLPEIVRAFYANNRLESVYIKVMTDGSSSGPTAATREPYTSDEHDSGILYWQQEELDDLIGRAHRMGWQCTVHAVGDRAIEQTLNAMQRAQREFPRRGLRHRIEHCGILPPDLQARVREQGIVPAMQPAFFWEFGDGYIANYGQHRADVMFPARSLTAAGVRVAGSSDAPVTHYAPLFGIQQAMTRATMDGQVCGPDERVELATAIRMHTINGAYASYEEQSKGSLEPGKLADLVVLGEDLRRVPAERIRETPVQMTVIGGRIVHES